MTKKAAGTVATAELQEVPELVGEIIKQLAEETQQYQQHQRHVSRDNGDDEETGNVAMKHYMHDEKAGSFADFSSASTAVIPHQNSQRQKKHKAASKRTRNATGTSSQKKHTKQEKHSKNESKSKQKNKVDTVAVTPASTEKKSQTTFYEEEDCDAAVVVGEDNDDIHDNDDDKHDNNDDDNDVDIENDTGNNSYTYEDSVSSDSSSSLSLSCTHNHRDHHVHPKKYSREPAMPESSRKTPRVSWKPLLFVVAVGIVAIIVSSVYFAVTKNKGSNAKYDNSASTTIFCCSGKRFTQNGLKRSQDVIEFLIDARISTVHDLQRQESSSSSDDVYSLTPQYQAAMWIADYDMMKVPVPTAAITDRAAATPSDNIVMNFSNSNDGVADDTALVWNRPNGETYGNGYATFVHRYALAVLYFALNRDGTWPNDLNFLSSKHVCEWTSSRSSSSSSNNKNGGDDEETESPLGVFECIENDFGEQIPSGLSLSFHGLIGKIPDNEFRHLDLVVLDLSNNKALSGDIPISIRTMTQLAHLALDHCTFLGEVPQWIGELTELQSLTLGNNKLSGNVPSTIGELKKLEVLGLDDNSLAASIDDFGMLRELKHLYLDDNRRIVGSLTNTLLAQWPNLQILDLSENKIDSTLPDGLFSHSTLRIVDLHSNSIRGGIPEIISGDNSSLEFLALQSNLLTGQIPESLRSLRSLRHLDLSKNALTSTIPTSLGELTNLKSLFLGDNNFLAGRFPSQIKALALLEELSLQNLGLVGSLPTFIEQLSNLIYLDVSKNFLSGELPESLARLLNLRFLILRENNFTSTLPSMFSNLKKLDLLLIDGNDITGNADAICQGVGVAPQMFIADCAGESAGFECTCCTQCCGSSTACNDNDWFAHVDSTWESEYRREYYTFGRGVIFGNECFAEEP